MPVDLTGSDSEGRATNSTNSIITIASNLSIITISLDGGEPMDQPPTSLTSLTSLSSMRKRELP